MAIVNRDKDASEQKDVAVVKVGAVGTGETHHLYVAPSPCSLQSLQYSAQGLSGALILTVEKLTGAGSSGLQMGISGIVVQARSTSGSQGFSGLAAQGSTSLDLDAGDVISVVSSGANSAVSDLVLNMVLKKTQDIVSRNGFSS